MSGTETDSVGQTPLRNSRQWLYCGKCGTAMEWRPHGMAFDRQSGKYGKTFVWTCPHHAGGQTTAQHDRANTVVHDILKERVSQ